MSARGGGGWDRAALGVWTASFALLLALWGRLPERVPVHFRLDGTPDRLGARAELLVVPAVALLCWVLVRFAARGRLGLGRANVGPALGFTVMVALAAVQVLTLRAALGDGRVPPGWTSTLVGLLLVAFGQLLPRTRRNAWVGLRLPWTLASDAAWARTHRCASWSFTLGGLGAVVLGPLWSAGAAAALALALLVPVAVSLRATADARP
ncbi:MULTISPECIES: SdpI family protein [Myxococcaceae]|uniref:SdpI family protein n=1 Tax=Myxococcaceae TaxID=31 RepID=UPI00129CB67A|nr:SdpI family protein [Simulacricoccus sp. 17bor-14]